MKVEDCKNCKFHAGYQHGEILCKYWGVLDSRATQQDTNDGTASLVSCPKEDK
jgi:hypothetical protein